MLLDKYLACNPDEEVDHCVCMLFFHRLWEHGLCPWHGLAATKHLKKQNKTFIFKQAFFGCHFLHPKHTAANPQRKKKKKTQSVAAWNKLTVEAAPVAVRNLLTSCPAAPLSRVKLLFTPLLPSPPAPTSLSDSGCQTKTGQETS